MPRVVSFIVLLAVIVLIGSMFFQVMVQFIVPLFLAAVLVVIFKPLHLWVTEKCGNRVKISAAVSTFLIVLIVLLPLGATAIKAVAEATHFYHGISGADSLTTTPVEEAESMQTVTAVSSSNENAESSSTDGSQTEGASSDESATPEKMKVDASSLNRVIEKLVPRINELSAKLNLPALPADRVRDYLNDTLAKAAAPIALGGVQALASTLVGLAIMVLTLYYFFADGPNMVAALMRLSPLDDQYEQELLDKFSDISRSVVVAVLLSAIVQGVLAGIGYFFAGVGNVFFLTVLTCFMAMVPFVGATIVWLPICLVLYFYTGEVVSTEMVDGVLTEIHEYPDGRPTAAILLALYCLTVVSMIDNLIKPLVLHGQANLHPLLALLSVIGGIQTLGPIGILVGPMLVAFLQALLNMLNKELHLLGKESDETGKPVVFATSAGAATEGAPPAVLPNPQEAKRTARKNTSRKGRRNKKK